MTILEKYASALAPLLSTSTTEEYSQVINAHFYKNELFHKVNVRSSDGDVEGVWVAFISEEDRREYGADSDIHTYVGILLNQTLCSEFHWGMPLLCQCSGDTRPFSLGDQSVLSEYTNHLKSLIPCMEMMTCFGTSKETSVERTLGYLLTTL